MGLTSGFPVDLILFGMIALFLVLRLRSILGRRTGFERPPQPPQPFQPQGATRPRPGPVIEGRAEPAPPAAQAARPMPEPASALGQKLARIQAADRGFDPARFIANAEGAFRLIVRAYASGDREQLRPLVSRDVFGAFDDGIAAREKAGQTQVVEIRAIPSATIEDAELAGTLAKVTVRFVSDQVSFVRDRQGQIVSGNEAVTELTDIWTFERDVSSADPAWKLVAVRAG
ncbi:MAG TPA: Tim44/TimA family putative adaptor protein [Acetobacteraceae bacterium]|nr:Tim44/TimA family putative adaptor protein [Acetobacteraceae bacterium]